MSPLDQNEKPQLDSQELDLVLTDKASGRDIQTTFTELLRFAREGDAVVVHTMDRLPNSLDDLRALVQALRRKGLRVEFGKEGLVFTGEGSPHGKPHALRHAAFAEFERSLIRERRKEASPRAKQRAPTGTEEDPRTGTGRRTGPTRQPRCSKDRPCPWLRNQSRNRLPIPSLHAKLDWAAPIADAGHYPELQQRQLHRTSLIDLEKGRDWLRKGLFHAIRSWRFLRLLLSKARIQFI